MIQNSFSSNNFSKQSSLISTDDDSVCEQKYSPVQMQYYYQQIAQQQQFIHMKDHYDKIQKSFGILPKRINSNKKEQHNQKAKKLFKTEMCKNFQFQGYCPWQKYCKFAHGKQELRQRHEKNYPQKQMKCQNFLNQNFCQYGYRCQFGHDQQPYQRQLTKFIQKANKKILKEKIEELEDCLPFKKSIKLPIFKRIKNLTQ